MPWPLALLPPIIRTPQAQQQACTCRHSPQLPWLRADDASVNMSMPYPLHLLDLIFNPGIDHLDLGGEDVGREGGKGLKAMKKGRKEGKKAP